MGCNNSKILNESNIKKSSIKSFTSTTEKSKSEKNKDLNSTKKENQEIIINLNKKVENIYITNDQNDNETFSSKIKTNKKTQEENLLINLNVKNTLEIENSNFHENSKIKINNKSLKNSNNNFSENNFNQKLLNEKNSINSNHSLLDRSNLFMNNMAKDYQLHSITERFSLENKEKNETQMKILHNETTIKELEKKNGKIFNSETKEIEDGSMLDKLSSIQQSKAENFKECRSLKDENEQILNLTRTHISQLEEKSRIILNSIENNDNLAIKFNMGNSLNNTHLKINESQSQQNSSHLMQNNPSILEENKSVGHSFKYENSNFDISKFSKFDSTNNISRIKVPYFDGNNQDNNNNFTLTNASNVNELSLQQNNPEKKNEDNYSEEEEELLIPITLTVRASKFEAMYPIWVEKDKEVNFKVMGKWTIDSSMPMCDYNGYILKQREISSGKDNTNSVNSTNYNSNLTNSNRSKLSNSGISVSHFNFNNNNPQKNNNENSDVGNKEEIENVKANDENENENINLKVNKDKDKENNDNNITELDNDNKENENTKNNLKINIITPQALKEKEKEEKEEEKEEENNNKEKEKDENKENSSSNLISPIVINKQEINNNNNNNTNLQLEKTPNQKNNPKTNSLIQDLPNGCLIGRILGGDYFHIYNNFNFISNVSGPLFLKMKINDLRLNPEGKLTVFIIGAMDLPFMHIEKRLGWDINNLSLGSNLLKTESEKLIYTFINKIRLNSNLFAQQYLENIKGLSTATNSLYFTLLENKEKLQFLHLDKKIIEFGKELIKLEIHRFYQGNNMKKKEEINSDAQNLIDAKKNLNNFGYKKLQHFVKKHEDTKPLSVAIKLIIDERARNSVLDCEYNTIALLTLKSPYAKRSFFTCMILANNTVYDNDIDMKLTHNFITEVNKIDSVIMETDKEND